MVPVVQVCLNGWLLTARGQICGCLGIRVMKPIFCTLLALPVALVTSVLLANRPPLLSPPGPWVRLKVYLGSNIACTSPDHPFPELRKPCFIELPGLLQGRVDAALVTLGRPFRHLDEGLIHAQVCTPLLGLVDDMEIHILEDSEGSCLCLPCRTKVPMCIRGTECTPAIRAASGGR